MKKGRKKEYDEAFLAYYGMTSEEYLQVLLKENGFTHWRDDKGLEAETFTEARDKVLAS